MKFRGLMAFNVKLVGKAAEQAGTDELQGIDRNEVPQVVDDKVLNMPEMKPNLKLVVNAFVWPYVKHRPDVCMFDNSLTIRTEDGKVKAQGGFIFGGRK